IACLGAWRSKRTTGWEAERRLATALPIRPLPPVIRTGSCVWSELMRPEIANSVRMPNRAAHAAAFSSGRLGLLPRPPLVMKVEAGLDVHLQVAAQVADVNRDVMAHPTEQRVHLGLPDAKVAHP